MATVDDHFRLFASYNAWLWPLQRSFESSTDTVIDLVEIKGFGDSSLGKNVMVIMSPIDLHYFCKGLKSILLQLLAYGTIVAA